MRIILTAIVLIALIVVGCTAQAPQPQAQQQMAAETEKPIESGQAAPEKALPTLPPEAPMGKKLAKNYYEFDQASYEKALAEHSYIFLDFYATWCPICQAEEPHIIAAMNEIEAENLIGFRVNYNDGQTDADEKALAKKYGITYQHTKIIISPDGSVAHRTLEQWNKQEALDAITKEVKNG